MRLEYSKIIDTEGNVVVETFCNKISQYKMTFRPDGGLQWDIEVQAIRFFPENVFQEIVRKSWTLEKHEKWLQSLHCRQISVK